MEINDIPQDNSKIFRGQRKVVRRCKTWRKVTALLLYVPLSVRPPQPRPSHRLLAMANQTTL